MIDVSIIIVSWNSKEILLECLQSLTSEKSKQYLEIIVVDNASSDGSQTLVHEQFPNVKLICNNANLGFAKANNIGIRHCTGRYICLVNSDVIVLKDCFDRMVAYMEKHHRICMLGPKMLNPDGTLQPSCMGFPTLWNNFCRALSLDTLFSRSKLFGGRLMGFFKHDYVRSVEVLNGCFLMVRREAMDQVGLLDESFFIYAEDIDWCKRFHDAGWDVVFFPAAEAIHYGGASSSNAPIRFYLEMQRADLQYWKKHHGRIAKFFFLLITLFYQINRILGCTFLYLVAPQKRELNVFKIKRGLSCIRNLYFISTPHEETSIKGEEGCK